MNRELKPIFEDIFRARRLHKLISKTLRSHNLIYAEFEILYILRSGKEYKPNELAQKTVQSSPRISYLLQMLHEKEYITMERSIRDRRCCIVKMQAGGMRICDLVCNNLLDNLGIKKP